MVKIRVCFFLLLGRFYFTPCPLNTTVYERKSFQREEYPSQTVITRTSVPIGIPVAVVIRSLIQN